jgi:hypothetical protein
MAVSVDTVYQTVLALANKEQRGYITPQEFNLFANHAQMDIFEQYFYDLGKFRRFPGNSHEYSDTLDILEEKISLFSTESSHTASGSGGINLSTATNELYRLGVLTVAYGNKPLVLAEEMGRKEYIEYNSGPLTKGTKKHPMFYRTNPSDEESSVIKLSPGLANGDKVDIGYIRKPKHPKWTYVVVNDKALWNGGAADMQNFELHPSEEENLVVKILKLAGVSIKDAGLTQAATQEEVKNYTQEKA